MEINRNTAIHQSGVAKTRISKSRASGVREIFYGSEKLPEERKKYRTSHHYKAQTERMIRKSTNL